jgi:hypothetical protein
MPSQHRCPACKSGFDTSRGLNGHLSQSACNWYLAQKHVELGQTWAGDTPLETVPIDSNDAPFRDEIPPPIAPDSSGQFSDDETRNGHEAWDDDLTHYVQVYSAANAGPPVNAQPSRLLDTFLGARPRALDEGAPVLVAEEHPTAGKVVRVSQGLHSRWEHALQNATRHSDVATDGAAASDTSSLPPEIFYPFKSEVDWKVAEWAVKKSIGHNAFNEFLAIDGVCYVQYHALEHCLTHG